MNNNDLQKMKNYRVNQNVNGLPCIFPSFMLLVSRKTKAVDNLKLKIFRLTVKLSIYKLEGRYQVGNVF